MAEVSRRKLLDRVVADQMMRQNGRRPPSQWPNLATAQSRCRRPSCKVGPSPVELIRLPLPNVIRHIRWNIALPASVFLARRLHRWRADQPICPGRDPGD
jgi:hypothetical protein